MVTYSRHTVTVLYTHAGCGAFCAYQDCKSVCVEMVWTYLQQLMPHDMHTHGGRHLKSCACVQLPVVSEEGGLAPPEFGFATSNPSATPGAARGSPLTWEAMRQVGAGFWLTDQQVRLLQMHTVTQPQTHKTPQVHPKHTSNTPDSHSYRFAVRPSRLDWLYPWPQSTAGENTATMSTSVQPGND